jgi:hypothetical protein
VSDLGSGRASGAFNSKVWQSEKHKRKTPGDSISRLFEHLGVDPGKSRKNTGKSREIPGNPRKSREILEIPGNLGKSQEIPGNPGNP